MRVVLALLTAAFSFWIGQSDAQLPNVKVPAFCTGNDSQTKLLLHLNGSNGSTAVSDTSIGGAHGAATYVGSTLSITTATSKFGGSAAGNGTVGGGNYWTFPNSSDFAFGTGDLTIDFWGIKQSSDNSGFVVWTEDNPGFQNGWVVQLHQVSGSSADQVAINWISGGVSQYSGSYGPAIGTLAGWHHYAIVRASGVVKIYVNGASQSLSTTGNPAASIPNSTDTLRVMGGLASGGPVNTDEIRISNVARWTANFTPPNQPYCP